MLRHKKLSKIFLALLISSFSSVCAKDDELKTVGTGDLVKIDLVGRTDEGLVFDSTLGKKPISFRLGDEEILDALQEGIIGMQEGETKTIHIPFQYAYGGFDPAKIIQIPREKINRNAKAKLGAPIKLQSKEGEIPVRLLEVTDDLAIFDANHILAGRNLNFEIKLISIEDSKKD